MSGPSVSAAQGSSTFACNKSTISLHWKTQRSRNKRKDTRFYWLVYTAIPGTLGGIVPCSHQPTSVLHTAQVTWNPLKYNLTALWNFDLPACVPSGSLLVFRFTGLGRWCSSLLIGYSSWTFVEGRIPKSRRGGRSSHFIPTNSSARTPATAYFKEKSKQEFPANSASTSSFSASCGPPKRLKDALPNHHSESTAPWEIYAYIIIYLEIYISIGKREKTVYTWMQKLVGGKDSAAVTGLLQLWHAFTTVTSPTCSCATKNRKRGLWLRHPLSEIWLHILQNVPRFRSFMKIHVSPIFKQT